MSEETKIHELKAWPEYYHRVVTGEKMFEIRRDDRGFAVGDQIILREFEPSPVPSFPGRYTGNQLNLKITYKFPGGRMGVDPAFCVLGIARAEPREDPENHIEAYSWSR